MERTGTTFDRRDVLRGAASIAVAGTAVSPPAAAQEDQPFGGWLENTSNFDGVVDERGSDSVSIAVGADGNNGSYAFDPPAVQVDAGTEVVWEWTGEGGSHNVVAEDGSFESDLTDEAGFTFSRTVESAGVHKYACTPHKPMGMKGVIVVGPLPASVGESGTSVEGTGQPSGEDANQPTEPDYGGWFDDVSNYETTVDRTGQQEVTVAVGAEGNDGNLAFDPPAVRVDPGTTVVWKWTGKGGTHNVAAEAGSFESEMTNEKGFTYERTFQAAGVHKYVCVPHQAMGMKGAIVVSGDEAGASGAAEMATVGGGIGLFGLLVALFFAALPDRGTDTQQRSSQP
ncbi:MAG: halocyanin domain-containing protein [Halolamina sp.]